MNSSTKVDMNTKMSTDAGVWYIIYNMHSWWTQASHFYLSLKEKANTNNLWNVIIIRIQSLTDASFLPHF